MMVQNEVTGQEGQGGQGGQRDRYGVFGETIIGYLEWRIGRCIDTNRWYRGEMK